MRQLDAFSFAEVQAAATRWPAVQRYLQILSDSSLAADHFSTRQRLQRQQAWVTAALNIFHQTATPEACCQYWSAAADRLLQEAWSHLGLSQKPLLLLALGKLGAQELNMSSDVDLVIVQSSGRQVSNESVHPFVDALQRLEPTGFCLRVDLTLRPGGRFSNLIPSAAEFTDYYGYHGETWEKLAYVRLRVLAGDNELREEVTQFMQRFSYRKHLDYTVLEDLKTLRAKTRLEAPILRPDEFHLKLGIGGIREVELFAHALQIVHGGRNPNLRTGSTTMALTRLREQKLLAAPDADFLLRHYWQLRDLENCLQCQEDQQTYVLRKQALASLPRTGTWDELLQSCQRASEIVASLLGSSEKEDVVHLPADSAAWLGEMGFREQTAQEVWPELLKATALSRRTENDEQQRQRFLLGFIQKVRQIGLDKDMAISHLLDFVRGTRAKASFFTLLNREPHIRDDLAWLFSTSHYLSHLLSARPELIDSYLLGQQEQPANDTPALLEYLVERRLLAELILGSKFLADRDLRALTEGLTEVADQTSLLLLGQLAGEIDPLSSIRILALGKGGGRELGLQSDLDFIFVTQDAPTANEQKISKRFISRMTEAQKGGQLYSIDLRLRPSGSAGPILIPRADLQRYLLTEAAAWERQSYLRARWIDPQQNTDLLPAQLAAQRGLSSEDASQLLRIRQELFVTNPGSIDLKLSPGGLASIEFAAQIALLHRRDLPLAPSTVAMFQYLEANDIAWAKAVSTLLKNYQYLRVVEQLYRLSSQQAGSSMRVRSESFARLAHLLKTEVTELDGSLQRVFSENLQLLRQLDPLPTYGAAPTGTNNP